MTKPDLGALFGAGDVSTFLGLEECADLGALTAPAVIIGAPGATYIPQAIAQAIVHCIDFGLSISDAIAAPRVAVTQNQRIDLSNRIPRYVEADLQSRGYKTLRSFQSYAFAGVHGIKIDDGTATGSADPGRDGMALIV